MREWGGLGEAAEGQRKQGQDSTCCASKQESAWKNSRDQAGFADKSERSNADGVCGAPHNTLNNMLVFFTTFRCIDTALMSLVGMRVCCCTWAGRPGFGSPGAAAGGGGSSHIDRALLLPRSACSGTSPRLLGPLEINSTETCFEVFLFQRILIKWRVRENPGAEQPSWHECCIHDLCEWELFHFSPGNKGLHLHAEVSNKWAPVQKSAQRLTVRVECESGGVPVDFSVCRQGSLGESSLPGTAFTATTM